MIIYEKVEKILNKYSCLLFDYSKFFYNNISLINNYNYLDILFKRGLVIIQNIFNISSIYLENITDILHLCEKGYIYFIEFINQLDFVNVDENFFELSIKDAVLFAYKKTIFNLTNKLVFNTNDNKIFKLLETYIYILNYLQIIYNRNNYLFLIQDSSHENINEIIGKNIVKNHNNINNIISKIILKLNINYLDDNILDLKAKLNELTVSISNINNSNIELINNFENTTSSFHELINDINKLNKIIH